MAFKYTYKKKINNEGIRRKRAHNSNRRLAGAFLLGVCLVLGMIFSGWVRWKQTEIIYRINEIEKRIQKLDEDKKEMQLELFQLQAFDRTRMIAEKQLGMVNAEPENIIKVKVESPNGGEAK
jgi:cell division protein FtsL